MRRGLPSERSVLLGACDRSGRPVPRGGGVVHLEAWEWEIRYSGGTTVAVMRQEPEALIISDDFTHMLVRYPISTLYKRGVVETCFGPVSGFVIPEPQMPESFDVVFVRDAFRFWEPYLFRYALLWRKN